MRLEANEAGLEGVLASLGTSVDLLLGQGGEAWVFALDQDRIARVNRGSPSRAEVDGRTQLLTELGNGADKVPFAIPAVLETHEIEGHIVTIERRLPGRPLDQVLAEKKGESRDNLVRAYLETAAQIGDLALARPWYGDLADTNAIRTDTFRAFLDKRAARSLQSAGPEFATINSAQLAATLSEPDKAAFVHLDAFPGNMMAEGEVVTAVIDFGAAAIMGDRRFDPLTAAIYLDTAMTPKATDRDRAVAQEWLVSRGLVALFPTVQKWIAAYWSFARNDRSLYQWCQATLLGKTRTNNS